MSLLEYPLIWPLLCLSLVGIGAAVRRGCGDCERSLDQLPRDGWVGWGIVLGFLQIWHLFLPLGNLVLVAVTVFGLGFLLRGWPRLTWCSVPILLIPAIWLASEGTLRSVGIDTGLYHLGAIRWAKEFSIVPGLGLLHDRFGFNNSSFLWVALCEHWPWGLRRAAVGIEILLFFSVVNALLAIRRMVTAKGACPRDVFDGLSLVPLLIMVMEDHRYDGPLSPDLLLFPLGLMVFSELLGYLEHEKNHQAAAVLLLSACAVTVKLSFAGAAVAVWGVLFLVARSRWRMASVAGLVAVVIGGPWSLRSVLLTGWPVYPLPWCGIAVPWKIPVEEVAATGAAIRAWAWSPGGTTLRFADWLASLAVQEFSLVVPALVGLAAAGIALYRRPSGRSGLALLPGLAGIVFWLALAPLPRFAASLPWALALAALAWALQGLPIAHRRGVALAIFVLLSVRLMDPWAYRAQVRNGPPPLPYVELDIGVTTSGLVILTPVEGDQCWDAPLPHAPRLDPRLGLRIPGDLGGGFRRTGSGSN